MIDAASLVVGDDVVKAFGRDSDSSPRAVHNAIAEACGVDPEALENYINHNVKNMARFTSMNNDMKSLVAVVARHCFAVGALCGRKDEEEI